MTISRLRPYLIALLISLPGIVIRFLHPELSPLVIVCLTGGAVFGASFLLTWACEVAEVDIPQALAVAVVAFIAVLPEYAVDMYFTWMAGQYPDSSYPHYAIANMTGANRLLIGVGWTTLVFIFATRFHRKIELMKDKRTDIAFLCLATVFALFVTWKGSLTLVDGGIFLLIYVWYMSIVARRPVEESEPEGAAAVLAVLPRRQRISWVVLIFLFAAFVIVCCAEPFSESLVASGKLLGVDEFLLVQWLAPIASEAPEFIVGILFALRGNAGLALGSLLSSKLNQWTLLVGMIPAVFAASSGGTAPIPLDSHQFSEIFLTAAQSFFALALIINLRLGMAGALCLLFLFLGQLFSPFYQEALEQALGLAHEPSRVHNAFAWAYMGLGVLLLLVRWRSFIGLHRGFRVRGGD